jgi:hypothetical protein
MSTLTDASILVSDENLFEDQASQKMHAPCQQCLEMETASTGMK